MKFSTVFRAAVAASSCCSSVQGLVFLETKYGTVAKNPFMDSEMGGEIMPHKVEMPSMYEKQGEMSKDMPRKGEMPSIDEIAGEMSNDMPRKGEMPSIDEIAGEMSKEMPSKGAAPPDQTTQPPTTTEPLPELDKEMVTGAAEPDGSCGKGFRNLVPGSRSYFGTAIEKLWNHPGRNGQADNFETELKCWYAFMLTTKCGKLPSQYDKRNKNLVGACTSQESDWLDVWKLFSKGEIQWWKKEYPAAPLVESDAATSVGSDPKALHYKQAMKTTLEINKKEMLCMALFVIDDDCGGHMYIRTES